MIIGIERYMKRNPSGDMFTVNSCSVCNVLYWIYVVFRYLRQTFNYC